MSVPTFSNLTADRSSPASSLRSVTPNDTPDLPDGVCKALYVGTSGDLEVIGESDTVAVVLATVPVGWVPIRAKRVLAGSTTADDIVALY